MNYGFIESNGCIYHWELSDLFYKLWNSWEAYVKFYIANGIAIGYGNTLIVPSQIRGAWEESL